MTRPYRRDPAAPVRACSRCRELKPREAFRPDSRGHLRSHCNPCALAATREWRAAHREELLERRRSARNAAAARPTEGDPR